jgi:hypothetical protein
MVGTQPGLELGGLVGDPMAAGALERRHDLAGLKAGRADRVRRDGQQLQRVRGGQVIKRLQRSGKELQQRRSRSTCRLRSQTSL